jgi:HAD superfamily phosphoserine phosphatase-like hydrolase
MKYRLVCFDIDGTLVADYKGGNYWVTLHRLFEGEQQGLLTNEQRHALFRAGKLSYREWVDLDLGSFQALGKTKQEFIAATKRHRLFPGAKETIHELKRRGHHLALISGSLMILIETLFPDHPFDDISTNHIYFNKDGLVKGWRTTVFDQGTKHTVMHEICRREGIPLSQTVFVGDGENDIDILQEAGLGIAFCPKSDKVAAAADVVIRKKDVREILKYLD